MFQENILKQLKTVDLSNICRELEVPVWGTKVTKINRILMKVEELEQENTPEAFGQLAGAEEMIREFVEDGEVRAVGSNNVRAGDNLEDKEDEVESQSHGDNQESVGDVLKQLASLLSKGLSESVSQQVESTRIAPQVPTFSGIGDTRYTTSEWLEVVEKFRKEFRWTQWQTLRNASARLSGTAKLWHEKAGECMLNFEDWKAALHRAVPDRQYTWQEKQKLLARSQRSDESLEEYLVDKGALCERFGLGSSDVKEFVLVGLLDRELAKCMASQRYMSIGDIIDSAIEIKRHLSSANPRSDRAKTESKKPDKYSEDKLKCLNCQQVGHRRKDCKNPGVCFKCLQAGHIGRDCPSTDPKKKLSKGDAAKAKQVNKLVNESIEEAAGSRFVRRAKVNGVEVSVGVDTQSDICLIREDAVKKVGPLSNPADKIKIRGITLNSFESIGMGRYSLEVDDVKVGNVKFYVVPTCVIPTEIWLGKDVMEDPRISILIHEDQAMFVSRQLMNAVLPSNFIEPKSKFELQLKENEVIKPMSVALIKLVGKDVPDGHVYIPSYADATARIVIEDCICQARAGEVTIAVLNASQEEKLIMKDDVVARCQLVNENNSDSERTAEVENIREEDLQIGKQSSEEEARDIVRLCNAFRECFSTSLNNIGLHEKAKFEIELLENKIVNEKRQPHSLKEREVIASLTEDLLQADIIEESSSAYCSPLVVIRKKDGSHRVCVDFRRLNAITKRNTFPSARIEELFENTGDWKLFTSLDFASGYYQLAIDDKSKEFTAFSTSTGHFQFKRMPFGLVNAPFAFNRLMNEIFGKVSSNTLRRYMDDLVVGGNGFEDLLDKTKAVLQIVKDHGLTLKLSKCLFNQEEISFVGYRISATGIKPGLDKTAAIKDYPTPTCLKDVRAFLGLTSYFRRFIAKFSVIARPLSKLLKGSNAFAWSQEQEFAFNELKKQLCSEPCIKPFDHRKKPIIHTDASLDGIGGVLFQEFEDGKLHPVIFISRCLTDAERKYHSTELELLAVVYVITKLRVYLYGTNFDLYTDCEAVRLGIKKRELIPRIARWVLQLQEYQFEVFHRAGKLMPHVDALSRYSGILDEETKMEDLKVFDIFRLETESTWISAAQSQDELCIKLKNKFEDDQQKMSCSHGTFVNVNGKLYRVQDCGRKQLVIPRALRREIIRESHLKAGHSSLAATLERVRSRFWFPRMSRCARSVIGACLDCLVQKVPGGKQQGYLNKIERKSVPFNTVHLDHVGPLPTSFGKKYLLVAVCNFTKMVFLMPTSTTSAAVTIKSIRNLVETMFVPERLVVDRGTAFKNAAFESFCKELGIKLVFTSTGNPRGNGQVERMHRVVIPMLAACCKKESKSDWFQYVGVAAATINSRTNTSTGKSPLELMYGFKPRTVVDSVLAPMVDDDNDDQTQEFDQTRQDALGRLRYSQTVMEQYFNKRRCNPKKYSIGDIVVVRRPPQGGDGQSRKLSSLYKGPFKIVEAINDGLYRIANIDGEAAYLCTAPVDQLKRWTFDDDAGSASEDEAVESTEGQDDRV